MALSNLIFVGAKHCRDVCKSVLLRQKFQCILQLLPAWQFIVSKDSNSAGEINVLHLSHPNVAGTAMIALRRQLASCEFMPLLIKLTPHARLRPLLQTEIMWDRLITLSMPFSASSTYSPLLFPLALQVSSLVSTTNHLSTPSTLTDKLCCYSAPSCACQYS